MTDWYVQKGARVQGPFDVHGIHRYLAIGRIRLQDKVSRDGYVWEPVTSGA